MLGFKISLAHKPFFLAQDLFLKFHGSKRWKNAFWEGQSNPDNRTKRGLQTPVVIIYMCRDNVNHSADRLNALSIVWSACLEYTVKERNVKKHKSYLKIFLCSFFQLFEVNIPL